MITLEIGARTPSLNEWQRWHHLKRTQYKRKLAHDVKVLALAQRAPKASGKRWVRITRRSPGQLDEDNLAGGCKALVDALVKAGLLVDDSPRWAELTYAQAGGQGVTIEIGDAQVMGEREDVQQ